MFALMPEKDWYLELSGVGIPVWQARGCAACLPSLGGSTDDSIS